MVALARMFHDGPSLFYNALLSTGDIRVYEPELYALLLLDKESAACGIRAL